jgi:hypothetical protein
MGSEEKHRFALDAVFPAIKEGPHLVIGNPPYADLGLRGDLPELARRFSSLGRAPRASDDLYPLFFEQMIRLAAPDAHGGALVLPLSLACNTGAQFVALRQLISQTSGSWRFAFFDREPHALFGEDVKTRNTIILWTRAKTERASSIFTGPLRKWRADMYSKNFGATTSKSSSEPVRSPRRP